MPTESEHQIGGGIGVALLLGVSGGFVDAYIFLHVVAVFVANMSGNLIRLGIASGQGRVSIALGAGVALVAFMVGVAGATSYIDRRVVRQRAVIGRAIFVTEAVLFIAIGLYMALFDIVFEPNLSLSNLPIVLIGGIAMGMQAVGLRRVGETHVSTTYGTGAVVRLSEKIVLGVRRAPRPGDVPRRSTIMVLLAVLIAYVAGAAGASAAGRSPTWLLLPAAIQLAAAIIEGR